MPIIYKVDILEALKQAGYNTSKIKTEKLIAEQTLQNLRHSKPISWATIETICKLLQCQPGDILEYKEEG